MDTLERIFLHQIAAPGAPGNLSAEEAALIRNDQAAILARPVITRLDDIGDVSAASPAEGQGLVRSGALWVARDTGRPLMLTNGSGPAEGSLVRDNIFRIITDQGLAGTASASEGVVYIRPVYGGTGTENAIARSDHLHTLPGNREFVIAATGSLSSGTRPLVSGTVSGLAADRNYYIDALLVLDIRGEGAGAGRSRPQITLNGVTTTRRNPARTVGGVDREATMMHAGLLVSGQTSFAVAAAIAHVDGDPKYIDGGTLVVTIKASR